MVRIGCLFALIVALTCGPGCGDPPCKQPKDPKIPPAAGLFLPVRG